MNARLEITIEKWQKFVELAKSRGYSQSFIVKELKLKGIPSEVIDFVKDLWNTI